jgi:hypothetical protein
VTNKMAAFDASSVQSINVCAGQGLRTAFSPSSISAVCLQLGSGDTKSFLGMEIVLIRSGEGLATPTRARFLVAQIDGFQSWRPFDPDHIHVRRADIESESCKRIYEETGFSWSHRKLQGQGIALFSAYLVRLQQHLESGWHSFVDQPWGLWTIIFPRPEVQISASSHDIRIVASIWPHMPPRGVFNFILNTSLRIGQRVSNTAIMPSYCVIGRLSCQGSF